MKQNTRKLGLLVAVFLIASCAPAPAATEQIVPPTSESSTRQGFHPLDTQTGLEEIDNILKTVAGGDAQMLRSLVGFTRAECTNQEGLGGPPKCREGEAEGTKVDVLPSLGPEGSFMRSDEMENWAGIEVSGLYAIYRVSPAVTYEQYYPAGEYAIVYVGEENQPAISLRVDNGMIVRVDYILDTSAGSLAGLLQREASQLILEPVS